MLSASDFDPADNTYFDLNYYGYHKKPHPIIVYYYALYALSVFSLAKSWQLILEINATYILVSYLLADN